jgi:hypothetical protein
VRLGRKQKIALATSGTAVVALGGVAWWILRPRPLGRLVCPASRQVADNDLRPGSYVVLELGSADGKFTEPTWAKIRKRKLLGDNLEVQLVGEINEVGSALPLTTARHGYALDQRLSVDPSCVWDVYRPPSGTAELVCGVALEAIPASLGIPRIPDPDASKLRRDDDAAVVIAAEGRPTELLWVRIESSSPGAQSLSGRVLQKTLHADVHGINQGDKLQFVRDCVVDVRLGGGL